jgi:tyrosyl-tRNA synthetase
MDEVKELGQLTGASIREAKEVLAFETTKILHGQEAAREARDASRKLFGSGIVSDAVPTTEVSLSELEAGIPAPELFNRVGLCNSRGEARRLILGNGAYVNDAAVGSVDDLITTSDLVEGYVLLRAGKKRYHRILAL